MPDEAALQERQRQLDEREQLLATREAQVAQQKPRNIATRSPSSPKPWSRPADCCRARRLR
ncbi:hypothetical protein AAIP21_31375 [Pseudomonas aeruginosa]|nr:hypothetical protein [Pseudomonas aeruginosa]MDF5922565.1 hypothetical protein [Pseudomonas aeruginosa]MDF5999870.1 hypothetical protein [Pseudomonas aeruginosa]MDW0128891.1 hypothetical protein [Pseudomonas aeruginosa]